MSSTNQWIVVGSANNYVSNNNEYNYKNKNTSKTQTATATASTSVTDKKTQTARFDRFQNNREVPSSLKDKMIVKLDKAPLKEEIYSGERLIECVKFSQDSVGNSFKDGPRIVEVAKDILSGKLDARHLPAINVVDFGETTKVGKKIVTSYDNRRLVTLKVATMAFQRFNKLKSEDLSKVQAVAKYYKLSGDKQKTIQKPKSEFDSGSFLYEINHTTNCYKIKDVEKYLFTELLLGNIKLNITSSPEVNVKPHLPDDDAKDMDANLAGQKMTCKEAVHARINAGKAYHSDHQLNGLFDTEIRKN